MKKRRLFGILLSLALMLTMVPTLAFATGEEDVSKTEIPENNSVEAEDVSVQKQYYPVWIGDSQVSRDDPEGPGWTYTQEGNKGILTLTNATINKYTEHNLYDYNIYSEGINLTVVLNGTNTIGSSTDLTQNANYAIGATSSDSVLNPNLTFEGSGILNANSVHTAIYSSGVCKIKGGQITAESLGDSAICAVEFEALGGKVSATSDEDSAITVYGDCKIGGGTVTATSTKDDDDAFYVTGDFEASSGNVTATGTTSGIYSAGSVIVRGGTIFAEGEGGLSQSSSVNAAYYGAITGINAETIEIKNGIESLTAIGTDVAIDGTVKNEIVGIGWKDTKGSEGKADIAVGNHTAVDLKEYRKVQFVAEPKPAPAPTPAPAANPLTVTTTAKTTTRATTIKWTWNAVDGASKYKVAYHKVGSKKWKVKTTKKTKYVLKGQKIKGLYEYKVAAVTASGDVWSDTSCRYFKTVKAKAKFSKGALKVSWKKDKGAAGYEIFIARNKKMDGAQVIQVAPTSKSYSVTGLEKGRYYVKVRPMKNYNGVTYTGILCKARKVRVK